MPKKFDNELLAYKKEIGQKEFHKLYQCIYYKTYNRSKNNKRYKETEVKPDLNKIKEKYKNGVTMDILQEMFL